MSIYKNKDITTNINERGVNLGNINVNFYTMDDGTTSLRIALLKEIEIDGQRLSEPVNLLKDNKLPRIYMKCEDGSIFAEGLQVVNPEIGLIQYKLSKNLSRHAGRVDAVLCLEDKVESTEVAKFFFNIEDSGFTEAIGKEIHIEMLDEYVAKVMSKNQFEQLNENFKNRISQDIKSFLIENADLFKGVEGLRGPKGEKGEPGDFKVRGTNLIKNGTFNDGINNFGIYAGDATYNVSYNTLSLIGRGDYGTTGVYTRGASSFLGKAGHKIYVKARMRVDNNLALSFKIYTTINGVTYYANNKSRLIVNPSQDVWYDVDGIIELPVAAQDKEIQLFFATEYENKDIAQNRKIEVFRPFALDLSEAYGLGNEPTYERFSELMNNFKFKFFDDTEVIETTNIEKMMVEVIEKNNETLNQDAYNIVAQNLLKNGNFTNGVFGYNIYGNNAVFTSSQNTLSLSGKGNLASIGLYTVDENTFTGKAGHKIFVKARLRVTDSECLGFRVYLECDGNIASSSTLRSVNKPLINVWYDVAETINVPSSFHSKNVRIYIMADYPSKEVAKDKTFQIYHPLAIDLSETFGEGVEWSDKQVKDFIVNNNGWFEDKVNVVSIKQYIGNLYNEVEDMEKENTKIGDYESFEDFSKDWTTKEDESFLNFNYTARKNLTGAKSLKMKVMNSVGTSRAIDKIVNVDLSNKHNAMMIKVWVENPKDVDFLNIYFGNESDVWSNYCRFPFSGDGSGNYSKTGGILRYGWNYLSINASDMIKTNKFDWNKPIKKIRVTLTPKTNNATTIILDSLQCNGVADPKFVITFDDAWRTVYENAYPKMKENGIVGTTYVIGEYIDNVRAFSEWFMTVDMLKEMEKDGWTSGNHTWMHNYYFGHNHTPESYVATIEKNRDWLLNNHLGGYDSGALHVCYPNGEYDLNVTSMLQAKGFKSARAAGARGSHPVQIDKHYELLSRSFSKNVTLEQAKKWIDIGLEAGGTTFLQFHQIPLDDTTTNGQENPYISWSKDKFEALMDYIVQKGLVDNCMTHAEWFEYAKRNNLLND